MSPQNPLKAAAGMAPLAERVAAATAVADHPRIKVTDIERVLGSRYTADTVRHLVRRFPRLRFVWLMGADNLVEIASWRHWPRIFATLPVAVFDRPTYSLRAVAAKAATRFRRRRIRPRAATSLATAKPPAWLYVKARTNPVSATAIRARRAASAGKETIIARKTTTRTTRRKSPKPPTVEKLRKLIEATLDDDLGEDIATIGLAGKTSIADYMIIASGRSSRQVGAMADNLREKLKAAGARPGIAEGRARCDWVLIDAGDIIIHLFRPEVREFYNLEKMWSADFIAPAERESEAGG